MTNPKRLHNLFVKLLIMLSLGTLTGCGQTYYGTAQVNSSPQGAEVINLKDDTHLGVTPLQVHWERDSDKAVRATIELHKTGYAEDIKTFWIKMYETKEEADQQAQPVTVELKKKDE